MVSSYVILPFVLAMVRPDPPHTPDRLSARWLLSLAAKLVQDMGTLMSGADKAQQRVVTFAVDGEIRFRTAAERAAFADELGSTLTRLVSKYHDDAAPGGRAHRLVVALHPSADAPTRKAAAPTRKGES
jgi:hypothetical protein